MNKRLIVVLLVAGLVLGAWLWWRQGPTPKPITPSVSDASNTTPAPSTPSAPSRSPSTPAATPQPKPVPTGGSTSAPWPRMPYEGLADPRWAEVDRRYAVDPEWKGKMAITFYGKVVDQQDNPIEGAKVWFQWSTLVESGALEQTTQSRGDGRFDLTGVKGSGVTVRISKDGYHEIKASRGSFEYARFWEKNYHEPDASSPVLFRLVKKGTGEPLLTGNVEVNAPANGTPVRVDLLNGGRVAPEGQVEIAAVTSTLQYPPRFFDWRAAFSVADGGLVEKTDELGFEAPAEGYTARVEFNFPAGAPDWKRSVRKSYYVRFGNPAKYGRVEIDLNGGKQLVFVRFAVNPSGSQSLEPGGGAQVSAR